MSDTEGSVKVTRFCAVALDMPTRPLEIWLHSLYAYIDFSCLKLYLLTASYKNCTVLSYTTFGQGPLDSPVFDFSSNEINEILVNFRAFYVSLSVSYMFVPSFILNRLGCKLTLIASSGIYIIYMLSNFLPRFLIFVLILS